MVETLLSPSNLLLYGRVLQDLKFKFIPPPDKPIDDTPPSSKGCDPDSALEPPQAPPRLGGNNFLQAQLEENPVLVRVYGYSFEGHYYDMAKPAIFLLHGEGSDPEAFRPARNLPGARVSRAPADADRIGVASQDGSFAEDMRVWSYDKDDLSIRLDPESGTFAEILLDAELAADSFGGAFSGMNARSSGMNARGRSSGMNARARTSGMNARGGNRNSD